MRNAHTVFVGKTREESTWETEAYMGLLHQNGLLKERGVRV
jgi:hypothetical protein